MLLIEQMNKLKSYLEKPFKLYLSFLWTFLMFSFCFGKYFFAYDLKAKNLKICLQAMRLVLATIIFFLSWSQSVSLKLLSYVLFKTQLIMHDWLWKLILQW